MRFFLPGILGLRYAGSKFMELEAGDNWLARLWKTYQTARLAFVDLRDITPALQEEIAMTLLTLGPLRTVLVVDRQKTESQWRDLLKEILGVQTDVAQLQLLDVTEERIASGQLQSDLTDIVGKLPAGEADKGEPGRQFIVAHVGSDILAKSGMPLVSKILAGAGLLAAMSLGALKGIGAEGLEFGLAMALLVIVLILLLAGLFRAAARARRLGQAGHQQGAARAWAMLSLEVLLFLATPALIFAQISKDLSPLKRRANEISAIQSLRTLNTAELIYSTTHTETGFACELSALEVDSGLAGGKKSGYTVSISHCTRTAYRMTAVPDAVGKTGDRGFCSDENLEISYDPSGGTDCTEPLPRGSF
jgi:type IV pilus assembly protein PilA